MSGSALLGFIAGLVGAIVVGVLINLLTKEAEGWLDVLPGWLLRLARHRLPTSHRAELYGEWAAELHIALHHTEGRPLSRLVLGIRYALGLLRTARKVADELGPTRARRVADSVGSTDIERLTPLGIPAWFEWDHRSEDRLTVYQANKHPRVQEVRRAWRLVTEEVRQVAAEAGVGCRSWPRCLRRLRGATRDERWKLIATKLKPLAMVHALCGGTRTTDRKYYFSVKTINIPTDSAVASYVTAIETIREDIRRLV